VPASCGEAVGGGRYPARMSTPDRPAASEQLLYKEIALLTAEFATEQALASLRQAVRDCRITDVAQWAAVATEAVMEAARLVEVPGESAESFTPIQDSVINCLDAMTAAVEADDADGVVSRGELVGDAVANFAVFLKGLGSGSKPAQVAVRRRNACWT
jgi:hypothetical protein